MDARNPACRRTDDAGSRFTSPAARRRALGSAVAYVRCPVCAGEVRLGGRQLICGSDHRFDIARQGYVNLTAGQGGARTGDTAAMVVARDRFLSRGHYQPLAASVRSLAAQCDHGGHGLVVDLAGGTGYYLAKILDALPHRLGLCLDLSPPALRQAARAHPRAAAIGADVWQHLPLAADSAATVLSVFGPRNPTEIDRILTPDGTLIIAVPGNAHLRELRRPLGLIGIDQRKSQRLADAFRGYAQSGVTRLRYQMALDHATLTALVTMGPSARHLTQEALAARIHALPRPVVVTADLQIRAYRRGYPG